MQYSETHSLREDAKFIPTSAEVSSRLKLVKSFTLACIFFLSKAGCGVERRAVLL